MCDQAGIMWQHTWASAEILSEFIATNPALWKGKTVMELGAGVAALPSMTALRCGAAKVIITEQSRLEKAFEFIRRNLERNFDTVEIDKRVQMIGFDWHAPEESIVGFCQNGSELQVDYLLGSDIFYDPSVFDMLINTLDRLFSRFPNMEFYFAYQIRDSDWTIEQQLLSNGLRCSLVRCVDTTQHSICIGKIYKLLTANGTLSADHKILENMDTTTISSEVIYYAGIEGGATHSTLVLIDSSGNRVGQWDDGPGLNCLLNGVERTADQIAKWVREAMLSASKAPAELIRLPIASLGMGLSGAEDESTNNRMLDYLREQHGDLAEIYFLTSDSVAAVATSFEKGGVVLIAGTGSACRILKSNGDVHGVGGWGHLIGDGGSAFWITMRAIRRIFDVEDGFGVEEELRESEMETIATVKQALLHHFNVTSKLALLDILYNPHFSKSAIASFCRPLAKLAEKGDTFAAELFQNAGHILGQHLTTIARHFDDEMFTNEVPVILIGSVFKSWAFLRGGFQKSLNDYNGKKVNEKGKCIRVVTFYQLECSSAIGAAILGSKQGIKGLDNSLVKKLQSRKLCDKITF